MTARSAKSRVRPHVFVVDPDVPGCCLICHLVGEPGDAHHTLPPAGPMDVQQLRAGEGGEQ